MVLFANGVATAFRADLPVVFLAIDGSETREAFTAKMVKHPYLDALRFAYSDPASISNANHAYRVHRVPHAL